MLFKLSRVIVLLALAAAPVSAEVVRIEVTSRADLVGGQPFGAAGPYEKLAGKIFFAVDPSGSYLYAANQDSDTIVCFRVDPGSGKLSSTGNVVKTGSPSSIVFV